MEIRRCSFIRETKVGLRKHPDVLWPHAYFTSAIYLLTVVNSCWSSLETNDDLMIFFLGPRNDLTWQRKAINIIKYSQ